MSKDRSWIASTIGQSAHDALARDLPASDVWSLLLDVLERRATSRTPAHLARQFERDGFTRPSPVDQRTLMDLDAQLLAVARDFESIELSPLAPLGVCSAMAPASQNKIVSALRATEVVSDPTNVLALEHARRLRDDPTTTVKLATSHRCVRAQPLPDKPGFVRHFRMFVLTTSGAERKDHGFLVDAMVDHVHTQLAALDRLERHGFAFGARTVTLRTSARRAEVGDRIANALADVRVVREPLEHAYYDGVRFLVNVTSRSGDSVPLIDGGAFDWVAKIASNRKLTYVASAIGTQLVATLFRSTNV